MAQQMTPATTATPDVGHEPLRMTYEEFKGWYTEARRGEWVDGEVIAFVAPTTVHQRLSLFLAALLSIYAQGHDLGEVLQAPEMRLRDGGSYREPDIVFVATDNASRITADGVDGPGDLVVEIVSDDSVRRDRKQKFEEYAEAGVREYWVIDPRPLRRTVLAYVLNDEGIFDQTLPNDQGEIASVTMPRFWLQPTWLWQDRTPNVAEILRTIEARD